jgi:hypothetical protein
LADPKPSIGKKIGLELILEKAVGMPSAASHGAPRLGSDADFRVGSVKITWKLAEGTINLEKALGLELMS